MLYHFLRSTIWSASVSSRLVNPSLEPTYYRRLTSSTQHIDTNNEAFPIVPIQISLRYPDRLPRLHLICRNSVIAIESLLRTPTHFPFYIMNELQCILITMKRLDLYRGGSTSEDFFSWSTVQFVSAWLIFRNHLYLINFWNICSFWLIWQMCTN